MRLFVPGVLQKGQQWEVYSEGPAGRPDAESPQVPSASSGRELIYSRASNYVSRRTECFLSFNQTPVGHKGDEPPTVHGW